MTFNDFSFSPKLAQAIARAGFKEPSPIQAEAIPLILEGKDVVGQAHTGTGKTAAFALPTLDRMDQSKNAQVLVIVPTRELAVQVADEYYKFSRTLGVRTATVYGGTSYKRQIEHVKQAGVVVATPGRLLDLLTRKKITIDPSFVILDEADEMLNMGFIEDVRLILKFFPNRKQTLLFSATVPNEIKELAATIQNKPVFVRTETETVTKNSIEQYYYIVDEHERDQAILRLLDHTNPKKAIVFCRTKRETGRLAEFIAGQGFRTEALHGDVEQWDRQKVMKAFRKNEFAVLVATDVAARGLDIRGVSHVFNYHIPLEPESYVHRIGRTGRADRDGVAMMLVTPHEIEELKRIQRDVGSELTLKAIPQKPSNLLNQIGELEVMVREQPVGKDAAALLKKISNGFSPAVVAEKLLMILADKLNEGEAIGKSLSEAQAMVDVTERSSETSTDSPKKVKRAARGARSKGREDRPRRGTERGEIPVPDISELPSGARIVARKLY